MTSCQGNKRPTARKSQSDWIYAEEPGLQTTNVLVLGTEPRNSSGYPCTLLNLRFWQKSTTTTKCQRDKEVYFQYINRTVFIMLMFIPKSAVIDKKNHSLHHLSFMLFSSRYTYFTRSTKA